MTFQPRANNAEQKGCDVWIMVGEMDAMYGSWWAEMDAINE
ncbi:MAG: hypothetical protein SPE66_05560 [Bilifractor sp.]|nr:hypothetical protein [Bilifractor sp.]